MKKDWLASPDNQAHLYAISKQALQTMAPHEIPWFEGMFPQYVELAQKGKVKTAKQVAKEFSLSGNEVFLTFIILQALVRVFELLLKENRSNNLVTLHYQIDQPTLKILVEDALKKERQTYPARQQMKEPIAEAIVEKLGDVYTPYENGLEQLLERLGNGHPHYLNALSHEHQLSENIRQARKYGDTKARRAERSEIIEQLNRLALSTIGIPFNRLCDQE